MTIVRFAGGHCMKVMTQNPILDMLAVVNGCVASVTINSSHQYKSLTALYDYSFAPHSLFRFQRQQSLALEMCLKREF